MALVIAMIRQHRYSATSSTTGSRKCSSSEAMYSNIQMYFGEADNDRHKNDWMKSDSSRGGIPKGARGVKSHTVEWKQDIDKKR